MRGSKCIRTIGKQIVGIVTCVLCREVYYIVSLRASSKGPLDVLGIIVMKHLDPYLMQQKRNMYCRCRLEI